jgi:molecular chaperone Hsp33
VVAVGDGGIAEHIERYFATSEQLPTRLWLVNDDRAAAGLLLQRLPGALTDEAVEDDWHRLALLAATASADELLALPPEQLLLRLFREDPLRVHPPQPLRFGCSCTRARSSNALRLLDRATVREILEQDGHVEVKCEFCGATYLYDAVDADALRYDAADVPRDTIH